MNKTIAAVAIILVIGGLVGWNQYLNKNRYYLVGADKAIAYEIDRQTGKTWMIRGYKKKEHKESPKIQKALTVLDKDQLTKVTGNADLSSGTFSGKLYNGCDWVVDEVIFLVIAKEDDGAVRWERKFRVEGLELKPLETNYFSVTVTGEKKIGSFNWGIVKALGYSVQ